MSDAMTEIYRGTYFKNRSKFKSTKKPIKKTNKGEKPNMTKKELIKSIAETNKASIIQTEEFYNSFEDALFKAITNNAEVVLSSKIGKFILKTRKARLIPENKFIINKRTGKRTVQKTGKNLKIPSITVVTLKLSKTIKDEVKNLKLN